MIDSRSFLAGAVATDGTIFTLHRLTLMAEAACLSDVRNKTSVARKSEN
jgi:hypothetical protein